MSRESRIWWSWPLSWNPAFFTRVSPVFTATLTGTCILLNQVNKVTWSMVKLVKNYCLAFLIGASRKRV